MKNKIFNHIILCGLLSSPIILMGMDTALEQKMPVTPRSTSPQPQTPEKHHHSHHSSHSTTPSDSSHPQAHHHHHNHHGHPASQSSSSSSLIPTLERVEEKIHSVGDIILEDIIQNPQVVTEILTPLVGQQDAQSATTAIELDASLVKKGIDAADGFVKEYKKNNPQQSTQSTSQSSSNNKNFTFMIGGTVITLAGILLLLYKYDYLPNVQQFFNKLASPSLR